MQLVCTCGMRREKKGTSEKGEGRKEYRISNKEFRMMKENRIMKIREETESGIRGFEQGNR